MLKRLAKDGEMKPEYRLPPMVFGIGLAAAGLFWYWMVNQICTWIIPILGQVMIGTGITTCFLPVSAYLVDDITQYAASANEANTLLRSVGGVLLPMAGPKMYAALGQGWGNTLLAGIVVCCVPLIWFIMRYGEMIGKNSTFQMSL